MAIEHILKGLEHGDTAALARAISVVENQRAGCEDVRSPVQAGGGKRGARRIGLTGPPGAGKSTLSEQLIRHYRAQGLKVAMVAVDPTSSFTGGALLGDRIRMESVSTDPGVFIRSMATRGPRRGRAGTQRDGAAARAAPVLATVATTGQGVADLVAALDRHRAWLETSGAVAARRRARLAERTRAAVDRAVHHWIWRETGAAELLARRLDEVMEGARSPYDVAAEILDQVKSGATR